MILTQYRDNGKDRTQRTMRMNAAVAAMRTETKSRPVSAMRERLPYAMPGAKNDFIQKVPVMVFAGAFRLSGSDQAMVSYNGLVMLELNRLASLNEAIRLRDLAATTPTAHCPCW